MEGQKEMNLVSVQVGNNLWQLIQYDDENPVRTTKLNHANQAIMKK
jgi:hypothetical protein